MNKSYKIFALLIGLLSILLFVLSFKEEQLSYFFFGAAFLVISILSLIFIMTIDLYKKDKEFDKEALLASGLHLTKCPQCKIDNVIEDKFCRICGTELVEESEL